MKDHINYYYHLNISDVEDWGSIYRFQLNHEFFYFVPFKRSERELQDLLQVCSELKQKGIHCHDIIPNRYGSFLTNLYQENYILLKVIGDPYLEYDLPSIININSNLILMKEQLKLYQNRWGKLWSDKIDYFEYQVHELGKDKPFLLDTFSYYVGLGENAIEYANMTAQNYLPNSNDRIVLSHKRIGYPNYELNFLNPLSFLFDLEVRDIAEYLKSSFFKGEDSLSLLQSVLRLKSFSIYSLSMLYARLLYPTYYFDIYEQVMSDKEKESALDKIVDQAENYEKFLKDAWFLIAKYAPIERVEWILNEKK